MRQHRQRAESSGGALAADVTGDFGRVHHAALVSAENGPGRIRAVLLHWGREVPRERRAARPRGVGRGYVLGPGVCPTPARLHPTLPGKEGREGIPGAFERRCRRPQYFGYEPRRRFRAPHRQLLWSHARLSGLGRRGARAARGITRRTRPWLITGRGGKRDRPDGRPYRIVRTLPMPRVTRPYSRTRWPRPLSVADRHRDDDAVAGDGVGAEPFSLGQASTRIMKL